MDEGGEASAHSETSSRPPVFRGVIKVVWHARADMKGGRGPSCLRFVVCHRDCGT